MLRDQSIGFIGGGNMGEALIRGLIAASLFPAEKVFAHDVMPSRIQYLEKELAIKGRGSIGELARSSSIIVLAVKPQVISQVLDALREHLSHKPLVISIAAGIALSILEGRLPDLTPVVRVMPNAPALVGKGASALSRGKAVSTAQMEMSLALFRAVGKAVQVEEKMMDTVRRRSPVAVRRPRAARRAARNRSGTRGRFRRWPGPSGARPAPAAAARSPPWLWMRRAAEPQPWRR